MTLKKLPFKAKLCLKENATRNSSRTKNKCCLSFRTELKVSFSSQDVFPLPVNYLHWPWLEAKSCIKWIIHLVNSRVLNFICLTSDENVFLEIWFSSLPRHGFGFKLVKKSELWWEGTGIKKFNKDVLDSGNLEFIFCLHICKPTFDSNAVRERCCSFRLLDVLRQPMS